MGQLERFKKYCSQFGARIFGFWRGFSDGKKADWYIDQTGRLGLAPQEAGYRPPAADVQQFQIALEAELSKMGM